MRGISVFPESSFGHNLEIFSPSIHHHVSTLLSSKDRRYFSSASCVDKAENDIGIIKSKEQNK